MQAKPKIYKIKIYKLRLTVEVLELVME